MYHTFLPLSFLILCHIFRVLGGVRHPSLVVIRQIVWAPGSPPCVIIRRRNGNLVGAPSPQPPPPPPDWSSNFYQQPLASTNIKQTAQRAGKYHPLKADFLSSQRLLAAIHFKKKSVKWYSQPWFWRQTSTAKIVSECYQLSEEIRLKGAVGSADLKISKSALLSLNHHNI